MVNNTTFSKKPHVVKIGNERFELSLGLAYGHVVCSCLEHVPPHLKPKHPLAWYHQWASCLFPSDIA
jgi:hypothetical protein